MVRYTAKDLAAQQDPRRFHLLPPPQIAGSVDGSIEALQSAYSYISAVQRKACQPGITPLVVQRMTVLGVANDVNYIVRGLAIAMRPGKAEGQLLLLPPVRVPERPNAKWSGDRSSLVASRTMQNVWHWLDGLSGASHRSIFWPSACQEHLEDMDTERLRSFVELTRNRSISSAAESLGLGRNVLDASLSLRILARGISFGDVPEPFRKYGLLWWWQVLTTYVTRIRGPLASRIGSHPAMQQLLHGLESRPKRSLTAGSTGAQLHWLRASRHALRASTKSGTTGELGWVPQVAFDAGLHIRMGDACGPRARPHQAEVRKCIMSLRDGLAPLLAQNVLQPGGQLFLATDSPRIVAEAISAGPTLPYTIHFLNLNRSKYDTEAWIELASAAERSQVQILEETLLDVLLLSRARFIAGSMYGNVPRLALQLRPTTPGDARHLAYVTTDGRDWCTKPTCMSNNTPTGRFW